ncbi:MAG: MBL fold metallo-hydrolase [Deltaproteobacteria bacterium]|nr:MBL fold metallo-hydrolase [Deltaproteobacteria bacterium]MBN2687815.1 MBL fold metallo-hydrolase [Deltaproteobacteria bacterium]
MITVTCFGGAQSVTGSQYLIENSQGGKALLDCGLFQGGSEMDRRNWEDWGYDPAEINSLILTHAHIDHSGRIPKLVKDGFRGRIITSPPTAELCQIMLLDSAHVQEMDSQWKTRKNRRQGKEGVEPLYTTEDAETSLRYFDPVERDRIIDIEPGIRIRLRNAGHVLGSSIVEMWMADGGSETKIVFSGDLGKQNQLIVKDPYEVLDADYLFMESTYGNRLHRTFDDSKAELREAILHAVSNNEKVIIPAFALERTQEILYLLGEFSRAGTLPGIPIYVDSPLAIRATEIFRKNKKYYDDEARAIVEQGFDPFDMPNLRFTLTTEESMKINEKEGPAIIISASGMCNAGRIKHHLKHNLWRPGASIIFAGFQAQGTTGRKIVDGAKTVKIFRENVAVRAKVYTIGGFSAHADRDDLLEWLGHFTEKSSPRVFVIHGEPTASYAFAQTARERYSLDVSVPRWREVLRLEPKAEIPGVFPEEAIPVDAREHVLAMISDVEAQLGRFRDLISTDGKASISEDDVERLKDLRDELQSLVAG